MAAMCIMMGSQQVGGVSTMRFCESSFSAKIFEDPHDLPMKYRCPYTCTSFGGETFQNSADGKLLPGGIM